MPSRLAPANGVECESNVREWPAPPNLLWGPQASPYPVILSLENHCSLEQQRVMAKHLRNILGPLLLDQPLEGVTTSLPSPEVCRRKGVSRDVSRLSGSSAGS